MSHTPWLVFLHENASACQNQLFQSSSHVGLKRFAEVDAARLEKLIRIGVRRLKVWDVPVIQAFRCRQQSCGSPFVYRRANGVSWVDWLLLETSFPLLTSLRRYCVEFAIWAFLLVHHVLQPLKRDTPDSPILCRGELLASWLFADQVSRCSFDHVHVVGATKLQREIFNLFFQV